MLLIVSLLYIVTNSYAQLSGNLYENDQNVIELKAYNFDSVVFNRSQNSKAFFVQFYLSWCGGCLIFRPKWSELANTLKPWNSAIRLASFNCAPVDARAICQRHGIGRTPTIKYFRFNSRSAFDGKPYTGKLHETEAMASYLASQIAMDQFRPRFLPRFRSLASNENLATISHPTVKYVAVIFEQFNHDIANQVILDFSSSRSVDVFAASVNHPLLYGKRTSYPALFIYEKRRFQLPVYISYTPVTRHSAASTIRRRLNGGNPQIYGNSITLPTTQAVVAPQPRTVPPPRSINSVAQHEVHLTDLKSAMSYMFNHEVAMNTELSGQKLESLQNLTHMLRNYFPGSVQDYTLLDGLTKWTTTMRRRRVPVKLWTDAVDFYNKRSGNPIPDPDNLSWVTCKGSKPYFRGYPCGLWMLLHTMSSQAFARGQTNALEILEPIRGYIRDFYGCGDCAEHFENAAMKEFSEKIKRPEDAILWLWDSHNLANFYLAGKANEDPLYPKVQFPPKEVCPRCHKWSDGKEVKWNEPEVVKFLVKMYTSVRKY